ncbi:protein DEHYDRATION-INDUCED 19 homolog 4-like isoform X1 [Lycium barbarum]|uniref:protein DEHYDRATION-INDUCED 19 homolog 4-like isoform X1 n=1 Tax=Lycium barbarum TaxID=112863 RepID=UPI00293F1EFF|nr:protein DEHYDRATION-INDUCED 19 homolog 4-like isoform X1 [Lycium barbarum]XP_060203000.1 protein DEHYDRATION-INDUCED 19 homolog 4-like isoform X1 [Lycium barbarum]
MDSDFWNNHISTAKRHFNLQHHNSQFDRLSIDDFEVEEEARPDFPCPYCYEDFDIASLCSHIEDEHSCESKATVCPICSVKVVSDLLSHITLQHGHLLKVQRRRRLRKVAIPSSQALSLLGKDLREAHLQVLLAGASRSSSATSSAAAIDPFLSSLGLNFPSSEAEDISKSVMSCIDDSTTKNATSQQIWKLSFDPSLSSEEREKRIRRATGRASFVQDLFAYTLLAD